MLNKIKALFKKEEKEKRVIVCIHGFGTRKTHEYDNFKYWSKENMNLVTFDIYVLENETDHNPEVWISRCESVVDSYLKAGYKVDLIGFSMGGVLATYLASKYDIGRLFLIAPAFEYMNTNNVVSKTKDIFVKKDVETKIPVIPFSYTQCFMEVVKRCKDSIKEITCPVCIVHGNKDEVISYKSSMNAFDLIPHDNKRLFLIHNGVHRMMMQKECANEIYQIFKLFMDRTILPDHPISMCKDIYE